MCIRDRPSGGFFPQTAITEFGPGDVPISVQIEYPIGSECFSTFNGTIPLREIPTVEFRLPGEICEDDMVVVELNPGFHVDPTSTYDWSFGRADVTPGTGVGPHTLTWPNGGGFVDTVSLIVTTVDGCQSTLLAPRIRVDTTLNPLAANLRCNVDNTSNTAIEFIWDNNVPGIDMYDITVVDPIGATITSQTGSSVFFDNLNPLDEITVELTLTGANSTCPPVSTTQTCIALDCDPIDIAFVPITDNCLDPNGGTSIQLEVVLTPDPGPGGTLEFRGDNVTADGVFTPDQQGSFNIEYVMEFNRCPYNASTTIQMIETPIADFSIDPIICEEDAATINFTGTAHPDAVLTWDFDNGNPLNTDPLDPQTLSWSGDPGDKTVSLSIDNSGCSDGPITQMITVDPAIDSLVIDCNNQAATTESVTIEWNEDPNVIEYDIRVAYPVGSAPQNMGTTADNTYTFNDVLPGQPTMVEITITPITDSSCPAPAVTVRCNAAPCPNAQLEFTPIGPLCVDGVDVPIDARVLNVLGLGVLTVDGPGVVPPANFDPAVAGEGTHTLTFAYSENGCDFDWTETVVVNPLPRVDAGADQILSCNDTEVSLFGSDHPDGTFTWTFENGDVVGNGQSVIVENGGTYTLEVTDANGCTNTDDVFVDAAFSMPVVDFDLENISCFGREDGIITINGLNPGVPPFEYSFNGGAFSPNNTFFSNLGEKELIRLLVETQMVAKHPKQLRLLNLLS